MPNERLPADALLAVYPDRRAADAAVDRVVVDAGVDRARIFIDAAVDEVRSLEGEVREEMTETKAHATVPIAYPKEAAKATATWGPAIVGIGAVLGALAALPFEIGDLSLPLRALVGAVSGAVMFSAIALVVLPAMSVRNPHDPSPAESGVTVRIEDGRDPVVQVLRSTKPQRLDRMRNGSVIGTVATEEDFRPGGATEELRESFAREARADPEHKTR